MGDLKNIGIAISTTEKRKSNWSKIIDNFNKYMPLEVENIHFDLRVDKEMKGVAFSKNASLKELYDKGCEYFYLFDDDVFLKRKGFFHWVYRVHKASNIHHFIYLNTSKQHKKDILKETKIQNHTIINSNAGSGCFLFLTRKVLDVVGGYDTSFKGYGYNHLNYSMRINKALNYPMHEFFTIKDMETFLHCQDFDGSFDGVRKKQTLTKAQKQKWIEKNNPLWKEKMKDLQIYYPL